MIHEKPPWGTRRCCNAVQGTSKDDLVVCALEPGHDGPHGWDRPDEPPVALDLPGLDEFQARLRAIVEREVGPLQEENTALMAKVTRLEQENARQAEIIARARWAV